MKKQPQKRYTFACYTQGYMAEESIDDLINLLQELRVQESAVIARIQRATQLSERSGRQPISQEGHQAHEDTANDQPEQRFNIGARVRIINKVKKPATAGRDWTEERERLATVIRVRGEQVHIVTSNGTKTWRAPNNLRIVDE